MQASASQSSRVEVENERPPGYCPGLRTPGNTEAGSIPSVSAAESSHPPAQEGLQDSVLKDSSDCKGRVESPRSAHTAGTAALTGSLALATGAAGRGTHEPATITPAGPWEPAHKHPSLKGRTKGD